MIFFEIFEYQNKTLTTRFMFILLSACKYVVPTVNTKALPECEYDFALLAMIQRLQKFQRVEYIHDFIERTVSCWISTEHTVSIDRLSKWMLGKIVL